MANLQTAYINIFTSNIIVNINILLEFLTEFLTFSFLDVPQATIIPKLQ